MTARKLMTSALFTVAILAAAQPLKSFAMPDSRGGPEACAKEAGQHRHGGHGGHRDARGPLGHEAMPPFLHGVKLSEAQRDKLFAVMHEQAPQFREAAKNARQSADKLRALTFAEAYDSKQANELAEAAGRNHGALLALRSAVDQQVLAILTAEQRQKVAAEIAARR